MHDLYRVRDMLKLDLSTFQMFLHIISVMNGLLCIFQVAQHERLPLPTFTIGGCVELNPLGRPVYDVLHVVMMSST